MNRRRLLIVCTWSVAVLVAPAAHAVDWNVRIEPGVAGFLSEAQDRNFGIGGGATVRGALTPLPFLDLHLVGGVLVFGATDRNSDDSPGLAWQVGGGLRVKRPFSAGRVSPWLDADVMYVRTGGLNRLGFTVGAGVGFAVNKQRSVRLGPFLRYAQITTPYETTIDTTDAKILIGGLSIEVGHAVKQKQAAVRIEAPPPPPPPDPNRDTDADGIVDSADKCPRDAEDKDGFEDDDGCPDPDNDKDGVLDAADRCPTIAGDTKHGGCPDTDGDGIDDLSDHCPTVAGPAESHGCPVHASVKVVENKLELMQKIFFANNKSQILPKSFPLLDEIAAVLKEHAKFHVQVDGYTDSRGNAQKNNKLSQDRAASVRMYLIGKGVAEDRLEAHGYGSEKPVDSNATSRGRDNNRRVEFVVTPEVTK